MTQKTFARAEAERMTPLLQSMTREIRERTRAIARYEHALEALRAGSAPSWNEVGLLRSRLANEARGLKAVRTEARRLGLEVDHNQPPRIVIPSEDGGWIYGGPLDGTQFHRLEETTA